MDTKAAFSIVGEWVGGLTNMFAEIGRAHV